MIFSSFIYSVEKNEILLIENQNNINFDQNIEGLKLYFKLIINNVLVEFLISFSFVNFLISLTFAYHFQKNI